MSTATPVPETVELTGDDARQTLRSAGAGRLVKDAFVRFRYADGFSHARSMAFLVGLVFVQGTIAVVGLASALGNRQISRGLVTTVKDVAPGPAGRVLTTAVEQAKHNGSRGAVVALVLGLIGTLVSGSTAMGQLERGLNRIYGIERDRPSFKKYARALALALTAGILATIAFLAVGFGPAIGRGFDNDRIDDIWSWVRWPLALVFLTAAIALLFRWCPNRHQPAWSWLAFGSAISVVLWFVVTIGIGVLLSNSGSFGDTYGPLAGIVALQFWALFSSMALLFGGAVAAQLEAVRAGVSEAASPALDPSTRAAAPRTAAVAS
jgi:YihY family inner membrane protein